MKKPDRFKHLNHHIELYAEKYETNQKYTRKHLVLSIVMQQKKLYMIC